jgi:hypothetical protein
LPDINRKITGLQIKAFQDSADRLNANRTKKTSLFYKKTKHFKQNQRKVRCEQSKAQVCWLLHIFHSSFYIDFLIIRTFFYWWLLASIIGLACSCCMNGYGKNAKVKKKEKNDGSIYGKAFLNA